MSRVIKFSLYAIVRVASGAIALLTHSQAQTFSFEEVSMMAQRSSLEVRSAREGVEAAKVASTRAARHWYPTVFLDLKGFATNEPALSFMSNLGQRRIGSADFDPASLNQPGYSLMEKGSLGVNLAIFEGGASLAAARASEKISASKEWEMKAAARKQQAHLGKLYADLISGREEALELKDLQQKIEEILRLYKVGSKSNPVGYSGLLGLKSLNNKVKIMLIEIETRDANLRSQIQSLALDLPKDWQPRETSSDGIIAEAFSSVSNQDVSADVRAAILQAEAMTLQKKIERSKFLPQVGVFAEGDVYHGERNMATSYATGAYLRWNLFTASNFGAADQAEHSAYASAYKAAALERDSKIQNLSAANSIKGLEESLKLTRESLVLLKEQANNAKLLFRSGAINALQLVEVLSRRADLLESRVRTQFALTEAHTILALNSGASGEADEN